MWETEKNIKSIQKSITCILKHFFIFIILKQRIFIIIACNSNHG